MLPLGGDRYRRARPSRVRADSDERRLRVRRLRVGNARVDLSQTFKRARRGTLVDDPSRIRTSEPGWALTLPGSAYNQEDAAHSATSLEPTLNRRLSRMWHIAAALTASIQKRLPN